MTFNSTITPSATANALPSLTPNPGTYKNAQPVSNQREQVPNNEVENEGNQIGVLSTHASSNVETSKRKLKLDIAGMGMF
ncbi:uncharacterized protein DS421_18g611030 [Arachis hypogaea]|nr:uncharacterized protein DS421_18g611030 [Arachis hypogaea]